ncbi:MAG: class I SAM-dependent methyltransferase [Myxococcales bacterium]|nr:class I SAM-dependent methyltransferase [Myxococcales bacterium]
MVRKPGTQMMAGPYGTGFNAAQDHLCGSEHPCRIVGESPCNDGLGAIRNRPMVTTSTTEQQNMKHDSAALFERTAVHDVAVDIPLKQSEMVRIDATLAMIPKDVISVLDVGCGPGKLMARIDRPVVMGTDLGRVGLKRATKPVVRSSITRLPFADHSVDLVLCAEVLEHLPVELVAPACAELVRVAKRYVLITVPYRENLLESSSQCPVCRHVFHLHGHQQSMDVAKLAPHFPEVGKITVELVWKVRPWSPLLLKLRTFSFGLWKYSPHALCPACGNNRFENQETHLMYRLFSGINQLLRPVRSHPHWLLFRYETAEPTAPKP